MEKRQTSHLLMSGGACGVAGTIFYVLTGVIPLNQTALYVLGMAWPILSIIFVFSLYQYVATEHQSFANRLSIMFAILGFTIVACMISVQLAVRWGIDDYIAKSPDKEEILLLIKQTIRLVDHGLDVAWDLFIGTSLIFLFFAIKGHSRFRLLWAIPAAVLGISLIVLNVLTFPWPPNTEGLFDIGPLIGVYIILLGIRLFWIGSRMRRINPEI